MTWCFLQGRYLEQRINEWTQLIETMADARLAQEAVIHARDEFGTYDWIIEGIIRGSGFQIDTAEYGQGFQTAYVCKEMKKGSYCFAGVGYPGI